MKICLQKEEVKNENDNKSISESQQKDIKQQYLEISKQQDQQNQKDQLEKFEQQQNYQTCLHYEKICLENEGFQLNKTIKVFNQYIEIKDGSIQFLHTYNCGFENQNKEILVLLHGYMGSSLTYVKCLKQLSEKYNVFAIDILGFGLSARPTFNLQDPQVIIDYFINMLEAWLKSMKFTKKINLAGHSFGGYLSGMFYCKNYKVLKKLFLISPVGGTEKDERYNEQVEEDFLKNNKFMGKMKFWAIQRAFEKKHSLTSYLQSWYFPTNKIIKKYFKTRLHFLPQNEALIWQNYFQSVFKLPPSTEIGFHELFRFPSISAKISLEQKFRELNCSEKNVEVKIYFGDKDWMSRKGLRIISYENQKNVEVEIIENTGHQIVFENPDSLVQNILGLNNIKQVNQ